MVVTGDRDLFQLIEPGVRVMATGRGITDTKIYDREAVIDRYGIPPELIPDFVGLKGDTSDNIPGVPGIGEKTASQLLQEWGDLEGVLSNIDSISGAKRKQNLTEHAENARISKQLATAVRDVDVDVDFDQRDRPRARPLAPARDVPRVRAARPARAPRGGARRGRRGAGRAGGRGDRGAGARGGAGRARLARGRAGGGRRAAAGRGPRRDRGGAGPRRTRTRSSPPRRRPRLEAVEAGGPRRRGRAPAAGGPAQGSFDFDAGPRGPLTVAAWAGDEVLVAEAETLAAFAMARGERPVVAHDWKTIAMADDPCDAPPLAHDTMVAAYLIDPARRGYPLDELATEAGLGARVRRRERGRRAGRAHAAAGGAPARPARRGRPHRPLPRDRAAAGRRAGGDGARRASSSTSSACARSASASTRAPIELERRVWELAGEEFTIGSPQQLAPILFDKLGLSRKRRGKTGFSTDARVLQAIRHEHEIVPAIEEWREVTKLKSTYLDAFPELIGADGRLHTTFNQTAATTGRLSSTNPNLQNIPIRTEQGREIRACFVAEPGIPADLGRLLAGRAAAARPHRRRARAQGHLPARRGRAHRHGRGDPRRQDRSGHALEGQDGQLRDRLRAVGFGLADRLQIEKEEAQQFIDAYLERFPKVKEFIDETIERAREEGHVATLFGRIRRVPGAALAPVPDAQPGRAAGGEHGHPGHRRRHHQGRDGARPRRAARRRAEHAAGAADPRRAAVRGPDGRGRARPRRSCAARWPDAFEMDPPLEVDVGVGENWLEAK